MIYRDWLIFWLENEVKPTAKIRTLERYSQIVSGHILPTLGMKDLQDITLQTLTTFISAKLISGNITNNEALSASSVNAIITVIQGSLRCAQNYGEITKNPADKLKRPRQIEREISCFTLNEQRRIEVAISKSNKDKLIGILLSLYTGIRIGELLALTWADIDFKTSILQITKSCHYGKTAGGKFGRVTETPKTATSRRLVPIPKQLINTIKDVKRRSNSQFVIACNENAISIRSYQKTFELLLKKLKIAHHGFHSLRHTFATRALECGVDVKTLSEILGHKNASITLNRYVHSLLEHKREMMNKVGRLFK